MIGRRFIFEAALEVRRRASPVLCRSTMTHVPSNAAFEGRCGLPDAVAGRLPSQRCSLWVDRQHATEPDQIRSGHRELEVLIDAPEPAVDRLADPANGLAPAEVLLD